MITFVYFAAVICGLAGVGLLLFEPAFGIGLIVVGALLFMVGARMWRGVQQQEQAELEERRHQEMVRAMREGKRRP